MSVLKAKVGGILAAVAAAAVLAGAPGAANAQAGEIEIYGYGDDDRYVTLHKSGGSGAPVLAGRELPAA
ncbi:MAG TPA: hypothetical protein PKE13_16595, partial [Hyphomicrobium zavarzinii]|nr:hypothetical protein [Hyphomicrobium zavarzinii]